MLTLAPPGPEQDEASDRELLRAAQRGSERAIETLVSSYWPQAYRCAALLVRDSQLAEDLAQEGLYRCIRGLDGFDADRPFAPWMRRVVSNLAIDWLRSPAARDVPQADPQDPEIAQPAATTDLDLAAALNQLTEQDRLAIVLQHVLGFSGSEVAALTGLNEATQRSRTHRGLARLRSILEGDDPDA